MRENEKRNINKLMQKSGFLKDFLTSIRVDNRDKQDFSEGSIKLLDSPLTAKIIISIIVFYLYRKEGEIRIKGEESLNKVFDRWFIKLSLINPMYKLYEVLR